MDSGSLEEQDVILTSEAISLVPFLSLLIRRKETQVLTGISHILSTEMFLNMMYQSPGIVSDRK